MFFHMATLPPFMLASLPFNATQLLFMPAEAVLDFIADDDIARVRGSQGNADRDDDYVPLHADWSDARSISCCRVRRFCRQFVHEWVQCCR